MKGMVFAQFLEMVEHRHGLEAVDQMIERSDLPNGGAYTSVGTYDHRELIRMVGQLSELTGESSAALVRGFGERLLRQFEVRYPQFFGAAGSTFEFLPQVESHIHIEVRKLYPDAELPSFACRRLDPHRLEVVYRSMRPFADLAEGLIAATARHFGEDIEIEREDLPTESGHAARFVLERKGAWTPRS